MKRLAPLTLLCALLLSGQALAADHAVTTTALSTFDPDFLVVAPEDNVNFTNSGNHNVTWQDGFPGAPTGFPTYSRQIVRVGTYDYFCSIHGTLASGMNGTVVAAGIGGRVIRDLDGDGVKDANEQGVQNVTVTLDGGDTDITDAIGAYDFDVNGGGAHSVDYQLPPGWQNTGGSKPREVTLSTNQASTNNNFLAAPTGAISGRVWNDGNGNGTADGGDAGRSGVTVFVDANTNGVLNVGERSDVTDGSGDYSIGFLAAGEHRVSYLIPDGTDNVGTRPHVVTLADDSDTETGRDFFVAPPTGVVHGRVTDDAGNGVQGATLVLTRSSDGEHVAGALTDASGGYSLPGIPSGSYDLELVQTGSSSFDHIGARERSFSLGLGESRQEDWSVISRMGLITGTVFVDTNANGVADAGELPADGAVVYLDANKNGAFDMGEGFAQPIQGGYSFSGLAAGTYAVEVLFGSGFEATAARSRTVTLAPGQHAAGIDFFVRPIPAPGEADDPDAPDIVFATTRNGTAGNDRMIGTAGADRIDGKAGNDTIDGRGGPDVLFGGLGRDILRGGAGNDLLFGGPGNDNLVGGTGNDRFRGQGGNDRLDGGKGRDTLDGGPGRDALMARDGQKDTVRCGSGRDTATVDRLDRVSGCERVKRR